jgi:hypothetical protein
MGLKDLLTDVYTTLSNGSWDDVKRGARLTIQELKGLPDYAYTTEFQGESAVIETSQTVGTDYSTRTYTLSASTPRTDGSRNEFMRVWDCRHEVSFAPNARNNTLYLAPKDGGPGGETTVVVPAELALRLDFRTLDIPEGSRPYANSTKPHRDDHCDLCNRIINLPQGNVVHFDKRQQAPVTVRVAGSDIIV